MTHTHTLTHTFTHSRTHTHTHTRLSLVMCTLAEYKMTARAIKAVEPYLQALATYAQSEKLEE